MTDTDERSLDRLTRWRLVLGGDEADGIGIARSALSEADAGRDTVLTDLYDAPRRGGLGGSKPRCRAGSATSEPTSRHRSSK